MTCRKAESPGEINKKSLAFDFRVCYYVMRSLVQAREICIEVHGRGVVERRFRHESKIFCKADLRKVQSHQEKRENHDHL